ncbi:MAG: hypothetical protein ACD_3C00242G0001 [uncultured bacterium (gcode 4)]|uniref:Uncharacterized protein n=1 Tax=uncultured bacterium (gcode 4) TaxID=1234023 RepID=K2FZ67_9BACT|nr:MAG: hypothetical protein ACD_3C00242G0001 [uncultured bacterium (gcode 4)]
METISDNPVYAVVINLWGESTPHRVKAAVLRTMFWQQETGDEQLINSLSDSQPAKAVPSVLNEEFFK